MSKALDMVIVIAASVDAVWDVDADTGIQPAEGARASFQVSGKARQALPSRMPVCPFKFLLLLPAAPAFFLTTAL